MPHTDYTGQSRTVGHALRRAAQLGLLTDAGVNPLTTVSALRALVESAHIHADALPMRRRVLAAIDSGVADGTLTSSSVAAANTVAGLVALTAADPRNHGGPLD